MIKILCVSHDIVGVLWNQQTTLWPFGTRITWIEACVKRVRYSPTYRGISVCWDLYDIKHVFSGTEISIIKIRRSRELLIRLRLHHFKATDSSSPWLNQSCLWIPLEIEWLFAEHYATSTVYWCIASKLKAPRNYFWMSNMFLWVEIFFFMCYHVVPKRHSQLDYELNGLLNKMKLKTTRWRWCFF